MWLAAAPDVYEYVPTQRCAPSALLFIYCRAEPAPADCSLITERRAARGVQVGCLLLAVVEIVGLWQS